MSDIDEKKELPHEFYSRLNEPENASEWHDLITYRVIRKTIDDVKIEQILDKLARNIKLIKYGYSENHKKRCRDVNHWFNEQIKTYKGKNRTSILSDATSVFNDIKWNSGKEERVCVINEKPYSSENADLMKELDDYCEIRDKNKCNILKDNNECLKCNKYIKEKKQYFTNKMQGIRSQSNCKWDKYTIDCTCTLNDMDRTFPEISCKGLSEKEELQEILPVIKQYSPLEIGFFFTPVGSIISRFRRRKYDIKRNIKKMDDDRYSLYDSDTMPEDSENKRYYIEYAWPHN
ncbi:unnamed protein product [Plasmodium vivax]|uniref:(malaria parasite P. vivax) hypothetical protein n=1 Tax=Plasmodium vivax TaxID=5855 RepID=A0A8S4HM33_PLAVI|nr:unnamed protein product [Plasmodium vivax]